MSNNGITWKGRWRGLDNVGLGAMLSDAYVECEFGFSDDEDPVFVAWPASLAIAIATAALLGRAGAIGYMNGLMCAHYGHDNGPYPIAGTDTP